MEKPGRIKLGVAILLLCTAALVWYFRSRPPAGDGSVTYFYDVSEKRLFEAPRKAFAPIEGIGGESGDGVEAVVVRCGQCGPSNQRIAYLRTHTPEFKQKKDAAERESAGVIEGLTREYIDQNTLIRLIDESEWHKANSKAGGKVVTTWKRRCATHGEWERPLLPRE